MQSKKSILHRVVEKLLWTTKKALPKKYHYLVYYLLDFIDQCKLVSLREQAYCLLRGIAPEELLAYDFKTYKPTDYLRNIDNYKKGMLNGDINNILLDKLLFEKELKPIVGESVVLNVVENIAHVKNGILFPINNLSSEDIHNTLYTVLESSDLILKPRTGSKGRGIHLVGAKNREDGLYRYNEKTSVRWESLLERIKNLDDYIIQKRFIQEGFSQEYYPKSLNTLRIATMIDPISKQPFIAYAVHRFGSDKTGIMDNYMQGGITAEINPDNGTMGKGRSLSREGKKYIYTHHPVSNKRIEHSTIPHWQTLKSELFSLINRFPDLKYVGWDIVVSNDQFFFLEGNNCPGLGSIQIHGPLKRNKSVWDFFEYYNFIKS